MQILVLDADQRPALAAVRSLGRAGYRVIAADVTENSLAGASRHADRAVRHPSPHLAPDRFVEWLAHFVEKEGIGMVLPITEVTTDLVLRNRALWPQLRLPFAPIAVVDALSDKVALYERALSLGVPVPRSRVIRSHHDLHLAFDEISFPAVLKPARSRVRIGDRFHGTTVVRVDSPNEALRYAATPDFSRFPYLFQSVVPGEGNGIFALYCHGEAVGFFAHRRLREKPPQGGVSVLSESCRPPADTQALAKTVLDSVGWHGVAMVEFKGQYLLEINARFWGSLQLAVDAGADFPRLLVEQELNAKKPAFHSYRQGVRLRWFLGDLDRLFLVFRQRSFSGSMRELWRFLRPSLGTTRHEVFRWSDPQPAFRELRLYVNALFRH